MSNVGTTPRTASPSWNISQAILSGAVPTAFRYQAYASFDGSPAAAEIWIDGQKDQRLYLPVSCQLYGEATFVAWNITDGDADGSIYKANFAFQRTAAGVVAAVPTNLSGSDGNPIETYDVVPGSETWAIAADDTNKAIAVRFTGEASKNYFIQGIISNVIAACDSMLFTNYSKITG